ncbi:hypothetical protein JCM14076_23560 [Methylosoma difficile]
MNHYKEQENPNTETGRQLPVNTVKVLCGNDDTTEISTDRQLKEKYNLEEWTDGIRISWM